MRMRGKHCDSQLVVLLTKGKMPAANSTML